MSDFAWDWTIAGCDFLSAATADTPMQRGFARVQRQQVDTAKAPGEQSMDLWWLRSQSTFTGGAGKAIYEPGDDTQVRTMFANSQGIDSWTDGQVKLLHRMSALTSGASGTVRNVILASDQDGVEYLAWCGLTQVKVMAADGTGSIASFSMLGAELPRKLVSFAGYVWVLCNNGYIECFSPSLSGGTAYLTYDLDTYGKDIFTAKDRVFATTKRADEPQKVYELADGTNTGGIKTLPAVSFEISNPSNYIYDAANAPGAVLFAGTRTVFRVSLTTSGELPDLTTPAVCAELPQGETLRGIFTYLGSIVVLATSRGIRIGQLRDDGSLVYGPLTVEAGVNTWPKAYFAAYDRFVYVGVAQGHPDGTSGLVRLDVSNIDSTGRAAWAWDLSVGSAVEIYGVAPMGSTGRIAVASGFTALMAEHATEYVSSGWLQTGQVLYGTVEPKVFRTARATATVPTGGSVAVSSVQSDGTATPLSTYTANTQAETTVSPSTRLDRLGLKFTLTRGTTASTTPVLTGYTLKALPAVDQVELISIPLMCFDSEVDKHKVKRGGPGKALARFNELVAAVRSAGTFTVTNKATGETFICVLSPDNPLTFQQSSPPTGFQGFGGIISITVRVV